MFGIEQEHFLFRTDGAVPSHDDMEALYDALQEIGFVERMRTRDGATLKVSRPTLQGPLSIKNDFCTNILEVAFPPHVLPEVFSLQWQDAFKAIRTAISHCSLSIVYGGTLPKPPASVFTRCSDTDINGSRLQTYIGREPTHRPLFSKYFGAYICATQVSLSSASEFPFRTLRDLYDLEYLTPLLFGNSRSCLGRHARCVRHFVYLDNWSDGYPLLAVPSVIPDSRGEYERLRASVMRDYGYVAPRGDRVEFRSCCSQDTIQDVLEFTCLRLIIERAVHAGWPHAPRNPAALVSAACELTPPIQLPLASDYTLLEAASHRLGPEWQQHAIRLFDRIERAMTRPSE